MIASPPIREAEAVDVEAPRLEVRGVTKRYGPVTALDGADLVLRPGEVVGLIGDNGAGKSTLVKVVSGKERPDDGVVLVDGAPVTFDGPLDARSAGIETVHQDLSLISTLDITDNVYLNRETRRRWPLAWLAPLDRPRMQRQLSADFERLNLTLPPLRTKVAALSGGQRQAVAIARAVLWGSHIVVLDEPTAALGVHQTELVLSFVEELRAHRLSIVIVSHNMDHIMRVCDRVTVLRLGKQVADERIADVDKLQLVAMMTGATAA